MKFYAELTSKLTIKNLSTAKENLCDLEIIFDEPVDFNKLEGYVAQYNYEDGKNHVAFDPQVYQEYLEEQAEKEAMIEANRLLEELSFKTVLDKATADEALVLKPLYPYWEINKNYMTYERAQNGGKLFECIKPHKSDKDNAPLEPDGKYYWKEIKKEED